MKYDLRRWLWLALFLVRRARYIARPRKASRTFELLRRPVFEQFEPRVLLDATPQLVLLVNHNEQQPCDVNGNGTVEPSDALVLINMMNAVSNVETNAIPAIANSYSLDVDGNQIVNFSDVEMVVGYLNSHSISMAQQATTVAIQPELLRVPTICNEIDLCLGSGTVPLPTPSPSPIGTEIDPNDCPVNGICYSGPLPSPSPIPTPTTIDPGTGAGPTP